jgi:hypothetical protein
MALRRPRRKVVNKVLSSLQYVYEVSGPQATAREAGIGLLDIVTHSAWIVTYERPQLSMSNCKVPVTV